MTRQFMNRRFTIEIPTNLIDEVDKMKMELGFNGLIPSLRFFVRYGLKNQDTLIQDFEFDEDNQKRIYINFSVGIFNQVQEYRFKNQILTKRNAVLNLLKHGLICYKSANSS